MADQQWVQDSVLQFGLLRTPPRHQLKELQQQRLPRWRTQLQELPKKHFEQLLRRPRELPQTRWLQFAEQKQARQLPPLRQQPQLGQVPLLPLQMQ
jgi:hypothetical protein